MSMSNTEKQIKDIRRKVRRKFSSDEKIKIVLDGLRGEWISSIALESGVVKHPSVARGAVIGKPERWWSERPLLIVVPVDSCQPSVSE